MEKRVLPEASSKSFLSLGRGNELGLGGWRFTLKTMLPDSSVNARTPRETPACFLEPNRSIGISQFPDPGYDNSEVANSIFALFSLSLSATHHYLYKIIKNKNQGKAF